jgi:hypothetical protein
MLMKNSINALSNSSDLHKRLYNSAKVKLNVLLNNPNSGNVEIKEEIPSCDVDKEPQDLKIALHVSPKQFKFGHTLDFNSRTVTLSSLTNPSVAVRFNAISPLNSTFTPDDKLFTALDFILKLVPQDFNSIGTHSKPQEGDINISLGDHEDVTPYQYTENESGQLVSNPSAISGLSTSRAPLT